MIVKKRIRTLDGFRGIFALMIILDHANNNSFITKNFIVRNSDYFVDYFFVLSGFVISYNYTSKIKSFSSYKYFIKKRLIRL
jgi:peptidoglycan/LPS O-acetylase OafA/YrhL